MDKEIYNMGLTTEKAQELFLKYGKNEIKEIKRYTLIKTILSQFNNFLTILLIAAGIISFFIGERLDSVFIFLIIVLNACFGIYQEFKAENVLSSLKKMTVNIIRTVRDNKEVEINSVYLVPGDIIYIEEGTKIPADARVVKAFNLEVNESSLTGESIPLAKSETNEDSNTIYMGTIVTKGRAYCEVVSTGEKTKFGQIAEKLQEINEVQTPLQKKLGSFTKQLAIIGITASVAVFILSFVKDKNLFESFIFAVSLAVAAVPEGLPAVMTITLAIGVEKMAKKKAIIRKLNAIEALGSVTLVATDKTGTLTTNQMTVKKIWADGSSFDEKESLNIKGESLKKLLLNGVVCSTASILHDKETDKYEIHGDTTEGAILILAHKNNLHHEPARREWEIVEEKSFDPVTKRMSAAVSKNSESFVFTKGAPESILAISNKILLDDKEVDLSEQIKQDIQNEINTYAKQGLRMIAFSYKPYDSKNSLETEHIFLGFVGIADPIRTEVFEAVQKAKRAGIKVVMITGDNPLTARSIGLEAGIIDENGEVLTGGELEKYSDDELMKKLPSVNIFARTSPMHKFRLVSLFQKLNEVVAVTGDGVNDALALKQADIGVAMGITGTDVAKETAHMIITDDNFATIISAIEQGRNIFSHIKNAIKFLLACNLSEIIYIISAVIFGLPLLTPLQILYINLITDGMPALSLAFSPPDKSIMEKPPRKGVYIFERHDYRFIFITGFITALLVFISVIPVLGSQVKNLASTIIMTSMILTQLLILADIWISHKPLLSNLSLLKKPIFLIAFLFPLVLQGFLIYYPPLKNVFSLTPLPIPQIVFLISVSFVLTIILEFSKSRLFRNYDKKH